MSRTLFRRWGAVWPAFRNFRDAAPAACTVVLICLAVFFIQQICSNVSFVSGYTFSYLLLHCFGLCPALLASGFVWQPVTYVFLHASLAHLGFNALAILTLGSGVELEIGAQRFWHVFLLGGVVGGVAWVGFDLALVRLAQGAWHVPHFLVALIAHAIRHRVVTPEGNAICVGASGGIFALVGVCAALFPRREMLLFMVWPVRARRFAVALGVGTIVLVLDGVGPVAHLTHLAGGVAGYLYGLRLAAQGIGDGCADPGTAAA